MKVYLYFKERKNERRLYAFTNNRDIADEFKNNRDMSNFSELIKNVSKNEYEISARENSKMLLNYRKMYTKNQETLGSLLCEVVCTQEEYDLVVDVLGMENSFTDMLYDITSLTSSMIKDKYKYYLTILLYEYNHCWYHSPELLDEIYHHGDILSIDELAVFINQNRAKLR